MNSPFLGVPNTTRTSQLDLLHFQHSVSEIFRWYEYLGHSQRAPVITPYFPIIQSSGTGKAKLVYDYKEVVHTTEALKADHKVVLVCCLPEHKKTKGYDSYLSQDLFQSTENEDTLRDISANPMMH